MGLIALFFFIRLIVDAAINCAKIWKIIVMT